MGNCLKCFQSSSNENPTTPVAAQNLTNTSLNCQNNILNLVENCNNDNSNNANDRICNDKWQETDELLSTSTPYTIGNNCDRKSNNYTKTSLVLLSGNTAGIDIKTFQKPIEISDNTLNKLFEEYRDEKEDDLILAEGIEKLCHDLNYQPDEFQILVLAWCLDAAQMCCFTKTEFIQGLKKINADNIPTIRLRLEQTSEVLKTDTEMFKQLYRFTFRFGLEPDQRILSLDMAISLWKLVFTVHTPKLLDDWIFFLEQNPTIRGIPKDTWNMFLNFSEQCDIHNYDDTEAWPSLFDDFVDYEKARLAQIAENQTTTTAANHDDDNNNDDPLQRNSKSLQSGNIL